MAEYISCDDRHVIMDAAIVEGDFVLASGLRARQKFEFDNISSNSRLLRLSAAAVSRCMQNEHSQPDAIVTVARGATCMGKYLEGMIGRRHIRTDYYDSKDGKEFYLLDAVEPGEEVVVVDDVYTSGTNTGKVIDVLLGNGVKPLGAVVLLNRSANSDPENRGLPVYYAMHETLL